MANSIDTPAAGRDLPNANLVSVVIPCSNQAQLPDQAIDGVLAQSYSNFKIIVVDDGSTDNTAEVVRRYPPARYAHQENAGPSAARNNGRRESRGEFLGFLDGDDRFLPHALETGVSCMQERPECAFVSDCRVIDSDAAIFPSPTQLHIEREHYLELLRSNYIPCTASVFYERNVFDFVHSFNAAPPKKFPAERKCNPKKVRQLSMSDPGGCADQWL